MKRRSGAGARAGVSEKEAEQMYQFWTSVVNKGGKSATAKKFVRSLTTICRIAKRDDWVERYKAAQIEIRERQDQQIVKAGIQNIKTVRGIASEAAKRIKHKLQTQPDFVPQIHELIGLIRLEEELSGNLNTGAGGDVNLITTNIIQQMPPERQEELRGSLADAFEQHRKRF